MSDSDEVEVVRKLVIKYGDAVRRLYEVPIDISNFDLVSKAALEFFDLELKMKGGKFINPRSTRLNLEKWLKKTCNETDESEYTNVVDGSAAGTSEMEELKKELEKTREKFSLKEKELKSERKGHEDTKKAMELELKKEKKEHAKSRKLLEKKLKEKEKEIVELKKQLRQKAEQRETGVDSRKSSGTAVNIHRFKFSPVSRSDSSVCVKLEDGGYTLLGTRGGCWGSVVGDSPIEKPGRYYFSFRIHSGASLFYFIGLGHPNVKNWEKLHSDYAESCSKSPVWLYYVNGNQMCYSAPIGKRRQEYHSVPRPPKFPFDIGVYLDCTSSSDKDKGKLTFFCNGKSLGEVDADITLPVVPVVAIAKCGEKLSIVKDPEIPPALRKY